MVSMANEKKVLLSVSSIAIVGAVAFGITDAFFSDTETSTGNILTAGDVDLQIDNTSYAIDYNIPGFRNPTGAFVASPDTSWSLKDLVIGVDHFFNFSDLKPGDYGEDTISIHVGSNNAWMCAVARITHDEDVGCTTPELADDANCAVQGTGLGELDSSLNFAFWVDDGDNVLEDSEQSSIFLQGPLSGIGAQGQITLADSQSSILGGNSPIPGGTTFYIGKTWCFGALTPAPRPQGVDLSPLLGTGFTCDGSFVNNAAQTDRVIGDMQFYATQSRNNSGFSCSQYTPTWPPAPVPTAVGALLSDYVEPSCDVTVDDDGGDEALDTIQEGVDIATIGQTVCVKAGTYTEDVNVNKSITLAGEGPTLVTLTGVRTGEPGALVVSADNATVKGFKVIGTGVSALRISGAHTNDVFSYNDAVAASGNNALLMDGGQLNHTASYNIFGGASSQLVYVNGLASVNNASTNIDFLHNTFSGSGNVALGQEADSSDIILNKFSTVTSFTDVEDWEGGNLYSHNSFIDAGLNLQHSENGFTGDNGVTNAEDNWWGDGNPSDGDVNPNADVDFLPFEISAFPEN